MTIGFTAGGENTNQFLGVMKYTLIENDGLVWMALPFLLSYVVAVLAKAKDIGRFCLRIINY